MGKYYDQAGHYRTYKDTGKTISVNGGPRCNITSWDYYKKYYYVAAGIFMAIVIILAELGIVK